MFHRVYKGSWSFLFSHRFAQPRICRVPHSFGDVLTNAHPKGPLHLFKRRGGPDRDFLVFRRLFQPPPFDLCFIRVSGRYTTLFPDFPKGDIGIPALSNKWKVWKRKDVAITMWYVGSRTRNLIFARVYKGFHIFQSG